MRVALKTKNKGIKHETYPCRKCSEPIKAGEKYYEWKHRYSAPSRQHQTHGHPWQSELCTGKMSGVYAAVENVAAVIDTGDPSGLVAALTEAAEQVREVAQEYEDNRSNMPEGLQEGPTGTDMQEKADALNEFADSLENAANDDEICNWEAEDDEPNTMLDHTDECAANDEVEEEEGKFADAGHDCDCGFTESEAAWDEWWQAREDRHQAALDAAQNVIDELSI